MAGTPAFEAAMNGAKREAIDAIRIELRVWADEVARVVRGLIASSEPGPLVRLQAALALPRA
jgi:hypothetical protein